MVAATSTVFWLRPSPRPSLAKALLGSLPALSAQTAGRLLVVGQLGETSTTTTTTMAKSVILFLLCLSLFRGTDAQALDENCGASPTFNCGATLICHTSKMKCKTATGETCTTKDQCIPDSYCVKDSTGQKCRFLLEGPCSSNEATGCITGSICDGPAKECKYDFNTDCSGAPSGCRSLTSCVDDGKAQLCKFPLGADCSVKKDGCQTAHICDTNDKCSLNVNANCTDYQKSCRAGTTCIEDSSGNTACKFLLDENCTIDKTGCQTGQVCDNGRCKLDANQKCQVQSSKCRSFSSCVAVGNEQMCKFQLTTNCSSNKDGCESNQVCDDKANPPMCKKKLLGTCGSPLHCRTGLKCFAISDTDNIARCYFDTGADCSSNSKGCPILHECDTKAGSVCKKSASAVCNVSKDECASTTVCIPTIGGSKKCHFKLKENCTSNSAYCATDMVCDGGLCRNDAGITCQSGDQCKATTHCASATIGFKCLIALNKGCSGYEKFCESHLTCDAGNKCKYKVNQDCKVDTTACVGIATCEGGLCKITHDNPCNGHVTPCYSKASCDPVSNLCKYTLEETCSTTADCLPPFVCDSSKKCKLPVLGDCTKAPTSCEADSECQAPGSLCT
ncbi:hypothetical protein ACOMHN_055040 [Nucella lapillus]